MKKLFILTVLCICLVLAACQKQECSAHVDADDNDICDLCDNSLIIVVDIYSINDLHGKLLDSPTQPGVDELSTFLGDAWETDDHVLLVSAGDMWQGSAESNLTGGLMMTDWMNEMVFTAMTLGNHEFDWGESYIEANADEARFPFLAINIYDRQTQEPVEYCQSSIIVNYGGVQVGIIGAIGDCYSSIASEQVQDVYFKTGAELTKLVKDESTKLRTEGADFIIYLLHDGLGDSYGEQVMPVSGAKISSYYDVSLSDGYVDLVFEGHSHQKYMLQDPYGVYHLQNGGDNNGISHVEVQIHAIDGTWSVQQTELISTDEYEHLEDSPVVEELMNKYDDQVGPAFEVLGTISSAQPGNTLRQLVADLYYLEGLIRWGSEYDIVLAGGFISIRDPGYLPRGEVTYAQLQGLFPFDNELVLCSIKGRDLKERFFESDHSSYFISYDVYGQEVLEHLDPDATYYVVVDTYTSTYAPNNLTEIERYGEPIYARDLLANYITMGGLY